MSKYSTSKVSEINPTVQYIVLVEESMQYDTGYGDRGAADYSTMEYLKCYTFEDVEQLKAWILENDSGYSTYKKPYRVLNVKPVSIVRQVNVTIQT